ncbi:hypothetical protein BJY52DRAFT_247104 [Lactarius psammicola]|nr:hypothetical protein BJY52DRAFT_247104 [Lactarius psammicola]
MFPIISSSDFRTHSFAISSRHLPVTSPSLVSTSPTFPFHPASISHSRPSFYPSIHRPSHAPTKMYYEDYDPRIGPAAMPPPCSEYAPYYSGCDDMFEDFLDEFEGKAYDCELTDPQRVDAIIRYVDLSIHELCRSLTGFRPRDWTLFRQSLLDTFGSTTPRPQVMRQKMYNYVEDSSRTRMDCVDNVLQYYRDFLRYSAPLVHTGHLTEEDRDTAFWCGFHPEDREVLRPRLIGKNPLQPHGIPFHFEDVLSCARGAFAYDGYFPSWSPEHHLETPSVRREQTVAEHVPQVPDDLRVATHAVASNAEITPDDLPSPSELTPNPQIPFSTSLSDSELQLTPAYSATVDHPEPESTFSNPTSTLPVSSSLSASEFQQRHTHSEKVDHPEHASMRSIPPSMLLPSTLPVLSFSHSLAPSVDDDDPEHAPTFSNSSSTFLPSTPSVRLTPSTADDDPKHAPTFSDSSFTPLLSTSPAPTRSLAHSVADDVSEIVSTPSPVPSTSSDFDYLSSATEAQPESELVSISPTTLTSLPLLPTPSFSFPSTDDVPEVTSAPPSSFSKSFDPECMTSVRMAIDDQPEPETAPISLIPQELDSPTCAPLPPSEPPSRLAVDRAPSPLTFDSSPVLPASSQLPASLLLPLVVGNLEFKSTPSSTVDVVLPSSPEPSPSSLSEVILHTPDANPRTCTPILPLGVTSDSSVTSPLEITLVSAPPTIPPVYQQVFTTQWLLYLVPQLLQEPSLVYEASSTPASCFSHYSPPLRMSGSRSAHFDFALIIVTTAVLVFVFPNVLATFLSHARKFGNKNKDLSDRQNSNLKTGNTFAQRLRLQYTQHGKRFVFDPGGVASSLALESTHENARGRKPKTRGGFVTTHDATLPTLVLVGNRTVFIAETLKFFSRRSLTGDGQDLNPLGGVRPALGLGLKRASRCHIGVTPFPGVPCILPYLF